MIHCQHSERGREGRLVRLTSDTRGGAYGAEFALGVDENTALAITDAGGPAALGEVRPGKEYIHSVSI